jgi:hypothetical protein
MGDTLEIPVYRPLVVKLPTRMLDAIRVFELKVLPWLITVWREGVEKVDAYKLLRFDTGRL